MMCKSFSFLFSTYWESYINCAANIPWEKPKNLAWFSFLENVFKKNELTTHSARNLFAHDLWISAAWIYLVVRDLGKDLGVKNN